MTGELPDVVFAQLTIYTDALVIRGNARLPRGPIAEALDTSPGAVLVLYDATVDEPGSRIRPLSARVANVRTDKILFIVADRQVDGEATPSGPSLLLAVPPFSVAGHIPVIAGDADLGDALRQVPSSGFVAVAGGAYWSESLGEGRRRSPVVVVNAARIQLVLPHRDIDPWAGLDSIAGPKE